MSALRFHFDEDCNGRIVRSVRRRAPTLNTVTALEAGLGEATDDAVLERAATESRVAISHDCSTIRAHAENRLRAGLPMVGLILVPQGMQLGKVIEELVLIAETTSTSPTPSYKGEDSLAPCLPSSPLRLTPHLSSAACSRALLPDTALSAALRTSRRGRYLATRYSFLSTHRK